MPQICQIIGVNSVTNIELDKGDMPAPIIRNACWFEKFFPAQQPDRPSQARLEAKSRPLAYATR